jgi:hypothetical protein
MICGPDDKPIRHCDGGVLQEDDAGATGEEVPLHRLVGIPALRRQRDPDRVAKPAEDRQQDQGVGQDDPILSEGSSRESFNR